MGKFDLPCPQVTFAALATPVQLRSSTAETQDKFEVGLSVECPVSDDIGWYQVRTCQEVMVCDSETMPLRTVAHKAAVRMSRILLVRALNFWTEGTHLLVHSKRMCNMCLSGAYDSWSLSIQDPMLILATCVCETKGKMLASILGGWGKYEKQKILEHVEAHVTQG